MPRKTVVVPPPTIGSVLEAFIIAEGRDNPIAARPTPTYTINVGDAVEVGSLENCVVQHVTDDGMICVISHMQKQRHSHETAQSLIARFWFDVVPKTTITPTEFYNEPYVNNYTSRSIGHAIVDAIDDRGYNATPTYQRDYVWTDADRQNLYESIFNARSIGRIVVLRYEDDYRMEFLDGKQRAEAIYGFMRGKYTYRGKYWHELSRMDRYKFEDHQVTWAELNGDRMTEADKIRVFLEVNAAGVPQDPVHIERLRARYVELTKGDIT